MNAQLSKNPPTIYLVWQGAEDEQFYNQYTSLEDAVSGEGDGVQVYEATPVLLGTFKRIVKVVKTKTSKKANKEN